MARAPAWERAEFETPSQTDYIIASRSTRNRHGLVGSEIQTTTATVHTELIDGQGGTENYRRDLSDYLPVTVTVQLVDDDD